MRYPLARAIAWIAAFLCAALAPMLFALTGPFAPRGFWVEFGVGLGFVGLSLLLLQFVLTGRYPRLAPSFGLDSMLQFHRQAGLLALILVLAHPAILFLADPGYVSYLDPRVNLLRALALSAVTGALLLLTVTSLWRLTFRLQYEWWRIVHGSLAAFILLIAVVHPIQVGHYVSGPVKQIMVAGFGLIGLALLVNTRLVRPARMKSRPYRVTAVHRERAGAATLVLTPDGHSGFRFRPGQFAWITLNDTPFTIQQHPYSLSSSAHRAPDELEFTIKEEGDFSRRARKIEPGSTAFLEGPYGFFVPSRDPGTGCVMIAGGVGITPCMSMLRTFADEGDRRPLILIYANTDLDEVIFREELDVLTGRLDLTLVHLLEEPPEGWDGEEGLLDAGVLERHVPEQKDRFDYFICGPEPMMNIAEEELLAMGVPQRNILSERFNMV